METAAVVFVSLFLSLTTGTHPVEVAVDGPIAAVELRLDGQAIATMSDGTWRTECDFGPQLLPHELVAVALDQNGEELARARQLVNVPRAEAETSILLQRDPKGVPTTARVVWQSAYHDHATGAKISFDGEILPFTDLSQIALPPHDSRQAHFLSAEVELPDGMISRSQIIFGGAFGEARSSLTAVPVATDKKSAQLTMADVAGCFQVDGQPVPVVAVEKGDASLFVIQDQESRELLIRVEQASRVNPHRPWDSGVGDMTSDIKDRYYARKMLYGSLPEEGEEISYDRFRFVHPFAWSQRTKAGFAHLFPILPTLKLTPESLRWFLFQPKGLQGCNPELRLTDALAVAGVRVAAESSRRAVLLVVNGNPKDHSQYSIEMVRSYLASIRVPLYIWSTNRRVKQTAWGTADRITTYDGFEWVSKRIEKALAEQWIVWLDGSYLPNKVSLTSQAKGFELVQ